MTPQTVALALLVISLVVTRLWEEHRWLTGRMSDRTSALLVVGRLPVLALGFTLITGQEPLVVLGLTALAAAVAAILYPVSLGRLQRSTLRTRD